MAQTKLPTRAQLARELTNLQNFTKQYKVSEARILRCSKCKATIDTMNGMCTYECADDFQPLGAREYIIETVEFLERVLFAEVVKPRPKEG